MPAPDPRSDLALLTEAAEAAGRIALRFWRRDPQSWEKDGGAGPVSEADLAVDAALKSALTAARPGYGWLSEETPDDSARLTCEAVFIVDPIDGTRAYLAGEEAFAVSVAVAMGGRITAAAVHLPARGITYAARAGGDATRNGTPIRASAREELEGADILTTRAALVPEFWPQGVPVFRRSFRASLAWRFCLAAEGRHDAMLTFRDTWEWDSAAGSLIAECAGCRVSDRHDRPLTFNQPHPSAEGVIVAPPVLHRRIVGALGLPAGGSAP